VSPVLLIAAKDLRLRLRDRSAILTGIVVPFVLALIFSLIIGGFGSGTIDLEFGLVDNDSSPASAQLQAVLESIEADGLISVASVDSEAEGRRLIDNGELGAVFVVPAGFGLAVESGQAAGVSVVGDADRPTTASIARSIAEAYAAGVEGVRLAASVAAITGGDVEEAVATAVSSPAPVALAPIAAANRQLDATTFFVAGMAVFFLFFTVSIGVTSLLEEKRDGTMSRLLAAPIKRSSVVGAKAIVSMTLGLTSMTVLVLSSSALLGADWGDPLGVAVLIVAGVVAAVGMMAVVAAFARTPEGAQNLQAVIAVGLGMLGGVFFPTPLGDGLLASLSLLTPHRWFMTGLGDLAGGGGVAVVLPSVAALLAFGLVAGGLAGFRLRRGLLS
jgi:ABC-2 type transport system permease protein